MLEPVDVPSLNDELAVPRTVSRRVPRGRRYTNVHGFAFIAEAGFGIRAFKDIKGHESQSPIRISKSFHHRFDEPDHEWNQKDNGQEIEAKVEPRESHQYALDA